MYVCVCARPELGAHNVRYTATHAKSVCESSPALAKSVCVHYSTTVK